MSSVGMNVVRLQLQIESQDHFYSLSKFQTVSFNDKDDLINLLTHDLKAYYERYTNYPIDDLFIRYTILPKDPSNKTILKANVKDMTHIDSNTIIDLPATLDLSKWGTVNKVFDNLYQVSDDNKLYSVVVTGNTRIVTVTYGSLPSKSFKDTILNELNDEFVREFSDGMKINYAGGVQTILVKKERAGAFMETVKKDKSYNFNAITMDLETRQIKTSSGYVLEVISIAFYNGEASQTYFCMDFVSSEAMIHKAIDDLFNKFSNSTIYIHNLSGFDGMFLLKALANFSDKFKIVMKEDKIISLSVAKARIFSDGKKYVNTLTFKDSLLLLPASLKSLGKGFSVTNKGDFDHNLTCDISDADLLYLREDLLKYNLQDCIVLYEVLEKFSILIFDIHNLI